MKSPRLIFCLMAMCVIVTGHAENSAEMTLDNSAERARITQQRADVEAFYVPKQQDCYARFAVSDCLSQARRERRAALEPLRRHEVRLNDLDREAKALAQRQRIQRNLSPERQQELALQRQQAQLEGRERQLRSDEKKAIGTKPAMPLVSPPVSVAPAVNPDNALRQQQRYTGKLQEASQRKADKAKSLSEKGKDAANSLPIPAGQ